MMRLCTILAAVCAVMAIMFAPSAVAQEAEDFNLKPMADEELGELRGGFFTVDGLTFDFGAIVRTTIDGLPALESRLTWTPEGMVIDDLSTITPGTLPVAGGWGLDLSDSTGTTLVGHRLIDGALQGFILNSGDNRDIRQDMQITLTLPGFEAVQQNILSDRLGMRIEMDMSHGLLGSSGN